VAHVLSLYLLAAGCYSLVSLSLDSLSLHLR